MMDYDEFVTLYDYLRETYDTPAQVLDEFWPLFSLLSDLAPKRILEIGVYHGGSLKFWDILAGDGAGGKVVGVDINLAKLRLRFTKPPSNVELIEGDSQNYQVVEKVKTLLPEIDFLFIDGDHEYGGAKADLENYGPLVRKGGIIAFDDVRPAHTDKVRKLWEELKSQNPDATKEFFAEKPELGTNRGGPGMSGIGVLFV